MPIAITGVGYSLPPTIRTNNDPIFDWLRSNGSSGLFTGFIERRVLPGPGTLSHLALSVVDLMITAARQALAHAATDPVQVDVLIGWASVSQYLTPNALALVHRELRLRRDAWLIPVEGLENFSTSLMVGNSLIRAEVAGTALIVSGCNWSQYVDYHTPQSISAGDGAGAAVLANAPRNDLFSLVDQGTEVKSEGYGGMFMQGDLVPGQVWTNPPPIPTAAGSPSPAWTAPYFHITEDGVNMFKAHGMQDPADLGNRLLARNGLTGKDVTLITHQASKVLMDYWRKAINPGQYVDTLATWANMVSATVPVNFAHNWLNNLIEKDYVLFLNPSAEFKAVGVLLKRSR